MSQTIDVRVSLAMSRGATAVAEAGALLSDEGVPVPLDKGDIHAIVLIPVRCCDHTATRSSSDESVSVPIEGADPRLEFNTAEHIITVADLALKMPSGNQPALSHRLHVRNGGNASFTYGALISLGGDFFGDPDHPISTAGDLEAQITQFAANVQQLADNTDSAKTILDIAHRYEFEPLKARLQNRQVPSGVYENIPWTKGKYMNDEDQEFDQATGGSGPNQPGFGRYTHLAEKNFDHFGKFARAAWNAGHIYAQRLAVAAAAQSPQNKEVCLEWAYAANAFADHFLTDLFAAGHMRTPRKELFDADVKGGAPRISSGYCVKGMHDEDNKFGLWIRNTRGDFWVAYGDARYRDVCNSANRRIMKLALQQSIDEVWQAFQTGTIVGTEDNPSKVWSYWPSDIIDYANSMSLRNRWTQNWAPLFWADASGYVYQRGSVNDGSIDDINNYDNYSYYWAMHYTGPYLRNSRKGPYMPQREYASVGYPYPPNEKGASGQVGWPLGPTNLSGYERVRKAHGPDLGSATGHSAPVAWVVDGTPEPEFT